MGTVLRCFLAGCLDSFGVPELENADLVIAICFLLEYLTHSYPLFSYFVEDLLGSAWWKAELFGGVFLEIILLVLEQF